MNVINPTDNPVSLRKAGFDYLKLFRETGDIEYVENVLACAQLALESPSRKPEQYKTYYLMAIAYHILEDDEACELAVMLGLEEKPHDQKLLEFRDENLGHMYIYDVTDPDVHWTPMLRSEVDRHVEWLDPPSP